MRTKIQHKLGGLLLAAGALLLVLPVASASATDYEGDIETSTSVSVESPVVQGADFSASATVSSDAAAAGEDGLVIKSAGFTSAAGAASPTGTVTFQIDGESVATESLEGGQADATLSSDDLSLGEHTVTAIYSGDDNYEGSSGSATVEIVAGSQGGEVADDDQVTAGTLPGVGGVDAWLIGAGALLVLGGGALLLVRRRTGLA